MKRRLFKLVLFLLFGAIVNVAVAWGCALWSGTNPEISIGSNYADFDYGLTPVSMKVWNFHKSHLVSELNSGYDIFESGIDFGYEAFSISSYESLKSPEHQLVTYAIHVGWPASSLTAYYTYYYRAGNTEAKVDSIREEWESGILFVVGESRWIPVRPLWTGFAINSILYATILWIPFAPFQLRRYLRVKRGLCIKCGYDLRETSGGCPECGWGRNKN